MINSAVVDIISISVLSLGDGSSFSLSVASSASTSASAAPTGMVVAVVLLVVVAVVVMVVVVDVFVAAMMVAVVLLMVVTVVATVMMLAVMAVVDCVVAATTATTTTATATITFLCGGVVFCCYGFSVSGCIGFIVRFIFRSVSIFCLIIFSFFTSGSWCVGSWTVATGVGFWCFVFCRIVVSGVFVSDVTDQVTRERSVPPLLWRR